MPRIIFRAGACMESSFIFNVEISFLVNGWACNATDANIINRQMDIRFIFLVQFLKNGMIKIEKQKGNYCTILLCRFILTKTYQASVPKQNQVTSHTRHLLRERLRLHRGVYFL